MTKPSVEFEAMINPSTGFSWDVQMEGTGRFEMERQILPIASRNIVGASSHERFLLQAVQSGDVTITFTYRRPWEGGERLVQYIYTFTINENLQTELIETQRILFDDSELSLNEDSFTDIISLSLNQ